MKKKMGKKTYGKRARTAPGYSKRMLSALLIFMMLTTMVPASFMTYADEPLQIQTAEEDGDSADSDQLSDGDGQQSPDQELDQTGAGGNGGAPVSSEEPGSSEEPTVTESTDQQGTEPEESSTGSTATAESTSPVETTSTMEETSTAEEISTSEGIPTVEETPESTTVEETSEETATESAEEMTTASDGEQDAEGTVAISAFYGELSLTVHWADNGNEAGERPDAKTYPAPALSFSVDGGELVELTAETMDEVGLSDMPDIRVSDEGDSYRLIVPGDILPSSIEDSRSGDEITRPVEWDMDLKEVGNYSLIEITEPGDYWYATAGAGWYYVLDDLDEPETAGWEVLSCEPEDSSRVYWADGHDSAELRPDLEDYPAPELYFARTSGDGEGWAPAEEEYRKLEEGTLKEAFLETMPGVKVTAEDGDSFAIATPGETLPASVAEKAEDGTRVIWTLKWKIVLPQVEHYRLEEVTEENAGSEGYEFAGNGAGWYYVLEEMEEERGVTAWEEASRQTVYWADGSDASGVRPDPADFPQPKLQFSKTLLDSGEEGDFTELTGDNLRDVCLEEIPSIEVTEEGDSFVFSHDGKTFPSEIVSAGADGEEKTWVVAWEMLLPEIDGYTLAEVTESDAEEGVYSWAEQGAGWYYVLDSEEGIRIDGYSDGLELQVFWVEDKDSEGDMNPDSEAYPDPELTFSMEEEGDDTAGQGGDRADASDGGNAGELLTEDNMEQLGLSELPEAQIHREQPAVRRMSRMAAGAAGSQEDDRPYTVESYRIRVDGEALPSRVTKTGAGGKETSFSVSWNMELQEVEGYRLIEVTEEMLSASPELYFFAAGNGAGIYYVSERVGQEGIEVIRWENDLTRTVIWVDNQNEGNIRPDSKTFLSGVKIEFAVSETGPGGDITDAGTTVPDGLDWKELNAENKKEIGLEGDVPQPAISGGETGEWTLSFAAESLPQELLQTDAMGEETPKYVYWRMTPPAADSGNGLGAYGLTNTDDLPDDLEGKYPVLENNPNRWYYVEQTEFSFEIDVRWGTLGAAEGLRDAILKKFYFTAQFPDGQGSNAEVTSTLKAIEALLNVDTTASPDPNNPNRGTITINGLPKYYYDGTTVSYWLETGKQDEDPDRLELGALGEDYFAIRFDNTDTAIVGNETDAVYSGGKLILTLTGTKNYSATKVWLDEADSGNRPTVEFHLWRYRAGSDPSTAAPVADASGKNMVFIPGEASAAEDSFKIEFKDNAGEDIDLPKYDAEGYEYIYVVREVMTGPGYEQVFGEVGADGTVSDFIYEVGADGKLTPVSDGRVGGNDFVYNGGTISNRLSGTMSSTVIKTWNAAAFQTGFEEVTVELTLQSREKGSSEGTPWNDTDITVTMNKFYAEHMTHSSTVNPPKYGAQGEELEYRWVESAVYQGNNSDNLLQKDGTFTLIQNGEEVTYRSESTEDPETGDTVITNGIADTIQYEAKKIWLDEKGEDISLEKAGTEVTFALYRAISGEEPDYTEPCFTFEMDGIAEDTPTETMDQEGNPVTVQETEPWYVSVIGLPEYNEEGLLYEYFLLEISSGDMSFYPVYKTERTKDGGYFTTITNGSGEGHAIIVQKYWTDSSDVTHREDVTLEVYAFDQEESEPIATVTLSAENGGSWNQLVGIRDYEPDEVYIVETKVGDKSTGYKHSEGKPVPTIDPDTGEGIRDAIHQFDGTNHKYEATYQRTVTQDVGNSTILSVTNRRLGEITIDVTKTWRDGEGNQRELIRNELNTLEENGKSVPQLVFYLDFGPASPADYEMTHQVGGGDTIDIANLPVFITSSDGNGGTVLPIDLEAAPNTEKKYSFAEVPKYDINGNTVNYEVRESWVVEEDGSYRELTAEELQKDYPGLYELYSEYRMEMTSKYEVGALHDGDVQTVTVKNSLVGVKDVSWKKLWQDDYTYGNNERPDLYLDLYQLKHESAEAESAVLTEYQKNYLWTQKEGELTTNWTATFTDLPKYDEFGYEIVYYAIERTEVNGEALGYEIPKYSMGGKELGTAEDPLDDAIEDGSVVRLGSSQDEQEGDLGEYALKEGGTFTNAISGETSALVRKKWTNLPTDYPSDDLPSVTFSLYQGLDKDENGNPIPDEEIVNSAEKAYATLTVTSDQWKSLAKEGAYTFSFEYVGENEIKITTGGDGVTSIETVPGGNTEPENAEKLPKFDEEGRLYRYVLREEITIGGNADEEDIYGAPVISGYEVTNPYESVRGSLAFRKYLKLPMNADDEPEAYPAVEFEISRTYIKNDAQKSEPEVIRVEYDSSTGRWKKASSGGGNLIWSSEDVSKAYGSQPEDPMVSSDFTVDGLEIYAPNGSEYAYTVTEVKDDLRGYDTWTANSALSNEEAESAISGNPSAEENGRVSVGPLPLTAETDSGAGFTPAEKVPVAATFINARQAEPSTIRLEGTKEWKDYGNAFGFRPKELTITVWRSAKTQPEQGNGIDEQELPADAYTIKWLENSEDGDSWTYEITGADGGGLEADAPNGMPWDYVVREESTGLGEYTQEKSAATETGTPDQNGVQQMTPLVNSITTDETFEKHWVDEEGKPIEENYLNANLSVTFRLHVREEGKTDWETDAETYFQYALGNENFGKLFGEGYEFEKTLTAAIDETQGWKGVFENLPTGIVKQKETDTTELEYRVVESQIQYGDYKVTIELKGDTGDVYSYKFSDIALFSPYYQDAANGRNESEDNNQYNQIHTKDFTVTKVWEGDGNNKYATRPETKAQGFDWETSFEIQRAAYDEDPDTAEIPSKTEIAEEDWSAVLIDGTALTVTVYGKKDQPTASQTITGLPESGVSESGTVVKYRYRARELDQEETVAEGETYSGTYEVRYTDSEAGTTATNSMKTTEIYAEKEWEYSGTETPSIAFTLEFKSTDENGNDGWKSVFPEQTVTLNGTADTEPEKKGKDCYEKGEWTAIWTNLPEVMPGSDVSEGGVTQYRVVEANTPGGYQQEESSGTGTSEDPYVIANRRVISYTVEKIWKLDKGDNLNGAEVTVGLWRQAGENGTPERVAKNRTDSCSALNDQYALVLTDKNLTGTFTDLPKYDGTGENTEEYIYFAREEKIGANGIGNLSASRDQAPMDLKIDGSTYKVVHKDTVAVGNTPAKTTIYNIGQTELEVTKNWIDDGDAKGLRPDDIELILIRQLTGGTSEELEENELEGEGITLSAPAINGNQWAYTYSGLWVADESGTLYTYSVKEGTSGLTLTGGDQYVPSYNGSTITNTLTGKTEVTVTKIWADGEDADGFRGEITLELRADNVPIKTVTLDRTGVVSRILDAFTDSGNRWIYTFKDLDKYDANGKRIEYTVVETKFPDGYEQGNMEGDAQNGFSITNTLLTSVTVEKKWRGIRPENLPEISVGLYRKAENTAGQPEKVLDQDGHQLIAVLDRTTGWTYTFEDLPRFDENGQRYEYTVQEQLIGGKPAADSGFVVHTEGGMLTQGTGEGTWSYTITNIGGTEISGTKTWKDNSNAYGTRPKELELTLYRKTEGGQEEAVKEEWLKADGSELIWTKEGDVWSYTYTGLPLTDDHGAPYTYRVKETVPAGYVSDPADGFAGAEENYSFTNTLTDRIDIPVVKVWEDNGDSSGKRPDSIEVILYANGKEYRRVTVSKDTNGLAHVWNWITGGTDDEWKFEFTELPKYDADGVLIAYSIEEKVPDGYDGYYETEDGLVKIINLREGSLRVTKRVSGTAGDTGRRFRFTVTLSDTSINGTYGEMEFVNGVAEIRLRHGESATASGLPAGIGYRISEEDVSENGYTTWAENASGEIVLDGTANAVFHNHRNLPEEEDDEEDPVVPVQPEKPAAPGAALPVLPGIAIPDTATVPASAQTGDFATPALYTGLAALACGSIAGILVSRRRRRKKKKRA